MMTAPATTNTLRRGRIRARGDQRRGMDGGMWATLLFLCDHPGIIEQTIGTGIGMDHGGLKLQRKHPAPPRMSFGAWHLIVVVLKALLSPQDLIGLEALPHKDALNLHLNLAAKRFEFLFQCPIFGLRLLLAPRRRAPEQGEPAARVLGGV